MNSDADETLKKIRNLYGKKMEKCKEIIQTVLAGLKELYSAEFCDRDTGLSFTEEFQQEYVFL